MEHGGNDNHDADLRDGDGLHSLDGREEGGEDCLADILHEGHYPGNGISEGMEVGEDVEKDVAFLQQGEGIEHGVGVVKQVAVGEGDRLGKARGARGGEDHGHILRFPRGLSHCQGRKGNRVGGGGHGGNSLFEEGFLQFVEARSEDCGAGFDELQGSQKGW